MRAYSVDLRQKIVDAVRRGGLTKTEVARTFGVSRSSVKRYLKMDTELGSLAPSKPPGSTPKITGTTQRLLELDLRERPAATLAQRCTYLLEMIGIRVGISTLWRALKRLGHSHKRRSIGAAERNEFDRAAWRVMVAEQIEADQFVDEMGSNTSMAPVCAWSPKGERVLCSLPRNRGKNTTLLASMTTEGMGPSLAIEGSTNSEVFETYIERVLVPALQAGQVVAMDNLNAHKGERVRELVEEAGCELVVSADPAFLGDPHKLNPEQLVVVAASSCQLLSFLAIATRARVQVLEYKDRVETQMPEEGKPMWLTRITLRPRIVVGPGVKEERVLRFTEMAHE